MYHRIITGQRQLFECEKRKSIRKNQVIQVLVSPARSSLYQVCLSVNHPRIKSSRGARCSHDKPLIDSHETWDPFKHLSQIHSEPRYAGTANTQPRVCSVTSKSAIFSTGWLVHRLAHWSMHAWLLAIWDDNLLSHRLIGSSADPLGHAPPRCQLN